MVHSKQQFRKRLASTQAKQTSNYLFGEQDCMSIHGKPRYGKKPALLALCFKVHLGGLIAPAANHSSLSILYHVLVGKDGQWIRQDSSTMRLAQTRRVSLGDAGDPCQ